MKATGILLRTLAYLLAVLLVLLTFSALCARDTVFITSDEPGVADLRDFDFTNSLAEITRHSGAIYRYPGAFYTSEDFAAGIVPEGALYGSQGDFGTMRMVLRLPPGEVYAITGKSISYAQRLYADGKEIGAVGVPAATREELIPSNRRYVEGFYAEGETTEIIFHYSVMVHADGGGLFPMHIGTVATVARAEQLRTLLEGVQAAALLTAFLFFFGLFLFFPGRRFLLWFALLCGCIGAGLLGANNNALMLMLPDVSFTVYLRLSYLVTCWIGLTSALYINGLFPGAANRWAVRGFTAYCAGVCVFLCIAPTTLFTRFPVQLSLSYVLFLAYLLAAILIAALRGRLSAAMTKSEGLLLLSGMALYIAFSGVAIFAHQQVWLFFGWSYQAVGILVFLFLNVLALTLSFSRTELALDEARAAEREIRETNEMLERLDRLKTNFLQNITHELNTPLGVISARAGKVREQLRNNALPQAGDAELAVIEDEAVRLGSVVRQLLDVSLELDRRLTLTDTDAHTLLQRAADFCAPVCKGRRNRITVHTRPAHIPLRANEDSIFRVLLNLITNANRQAHSGVIALSAEYGPDGMVAFTVTDQGGGVAPALLEEAFRRGVSGGGGKGLGLAICKEIVERHGGGIAITNTGDGARVRFTLPIGEEENRHER